MKDEIAGLAREVRFFYVCVLWNMLDSGAGKSHQSEEGRLLVVIDVLFEVPKNSRLANLIVTDAVTLLNRFESGIGAALVVAVKVAVDGQLVRSTPDSSGRGCR